MAYRISWLNMVLALCISGCTGCPNTALDCDPGTHQVGDTCLPDARVDAGPDVPGDAGNDAMDASDGGSDAGACGRDCTLESKQCDEDSMMCVTCVRDDECVMPEASVCGADGECTACDDTGPAGQCAGVLRDETALNVCSGGTCVECTGADETACGTNVCDVLMGTCTGTMAGDAGLCEECVSDRECGEGKVCAPQMGTLDAGGTALIGYFCHWDIDAPLPEGPEGACSRVAPFVTPEAGVTTVSGATAEVCQLRAASCPAYSHFSTAGSAPVVDPPSCTMNSDCGAEGFEDGYCRMLDVASDRCTMACDGDEDCTRVGSRNEYNCNEGIGECTFVRL